MVSECSRPLMLKPCEAVVRAANLCREVVKTVYLCVHPCTTDTKINGPQNFQIKVGATAESP